MNGATAAGFALVLSTLLGGCTSQQAEPFGVGDETATPRGDAFQLLPSAATNENRPASEAGPRPYRFFLNMTLLQNSGPQILPLLRGFSSGGHCVHVEKGNFTSIAGTARWSSLNPTTDQLRITAWQDRILADKTSGSPLEFNFTFLPSVLGTVDLEIDGPGLMVTGADQIPIQVELVVVSSGSEVPAASDPFACAHAG